jgi:hypothetical protein
MVRKKRRENRTPMETVKWKKFGICIICSYMKDLEIQLGEGKKKRFCIKDSVKNLWA